MHVSTLSGKYVKFDEHTMSLSDGRHTWKLGDTMRLKVVRVDWNNRWVDFVPAELERKGRRR